MAEKTVYERSLELHEKGPGKVEVISKVKVENREDLSLAYTPGVAEPCRKIHANPDDVYKYTAKGNVLTKASSQTLMSAKGNKTEELTLEDSEKPKKVEGVSRYTVNKIVLTDKYKDIDKAMFYRFAGNADTINTINLINENAKVVLNGPLLGEIPILVLSSDSGDDWNNVQTQLASWSENSEQEMIEASEHYLYWSNFNQVSGRIASFVEKISKGGIL